MNCSNSPDKTSEKIELLQKQAKHGQPNKSQNEISESLSTSREDGSKLKQPSDGAKQKKVHQCDLCDYTASRAGQLRRHRESRHSGLVHSCGQCRYTTRVEADLARHKRLKHAADPSGYHLEPLQPSVHHKDLKEEHLKPGFPCEVLIEEGSEVLQFDDQEIEEGKQQGSTLLPSLYYSQVIKLGPEIEVTLVKCSSENSEGEVDFTNVCCNYDR